MNDQWTATEDIAKGQAVMLRADGTAWPAEPEELPRFHVGTGGSCANRHARLIDVLERIRTIAADPKFNEDGVLRVRLDMIAQMAEQAVKEYGEGQTP